MALADTRRAIGAVGTLLQAQLMAKTTHPVDIGRPDNAALTGGPKLNLFLYQVDVDGQLRNYPLDQGQVSPMWMVLRYLLTAFDVDKESDSIVAHELLGEAMLALQELNFIHPAKTNVALAENPEPLKITFDSADTELLSKIMQGTDEKYRVSAAFQVRPVMLASTEPPFYALPVKSVGPPGNEGVVVLPSLGPRLEAIVPEKFAIRDAVVLTGVDIGADVYQVCIGNICLPSTAQKTGLVQTTIPEDIDLSAGSYPVTVRRMLPSGRHLGSNALLGHLLPILDDAVLTGCDTINDKVFGTLELTGALLGGEDDSIFIAFYQDGAIRLMLEPGGVLDQTSMSVPVDQDDALPPGRYRIILRVNGEQALNAPEVNWSCPP